MKMNNNRPTPQKTSKQTKTIWMQLNESPWEMFAFSVYIIQITTFFPGN